MIKACIALSLDWHILALLLVFILLGLAKEIAYIHKAKTVPKIVVAVASSRYFLLGSIVLGLALLILTYNMANEYYALNVKGTHQLALSDLPSIHSMLRRSSGFASELDERIWGPPVPWVEVWLRQFKRIGLLSVPYAWLGQVLSSPDVSWAGQIVRYVGIGVVGICIVGVFFVRHRLLAATAVLAGFCWAILMYNSANVHSYEALYYIGIPVFMYTMILSGIRKLSGDRCMPFAAGVGLLIFALSSYQINRVEYDNRFSAEFQKMMMDDYDNIRVFTRGKNVFVPVPDNATEQLIEFSGTRFGLHYFLSGSRILFNDFGCDRSLGWADFVVRTRRDGGPGLLTPDNRVVFLYDRRVHEEYVDGLVAGGVPVVRGDFDVYLTDDRRLVYVGDRCGEVGSGLFLGVPISLSIYPVDAADLPGAGHEFRELAYIEHFVLDTRRHVVIFDLPDYGISRIATGQYGEGGRIWGGSFFGPDHEPDAGLLARAGRAAAAGGPAARGRFDVYLSDGSLLYVKEPCRGADVSDGFFVHVVPVDRGDLPEHRRELGFDNLDFAFVDRGTGDGVRCAAEIGLPDYDIDRIATGQYNDQGRTWQNEVRVSR